ncbi:MAG: SDR family oxidoreductase [Anaerolineaceae bacterium]|nr:SDR family oxidoreductase [Anaerolineaceae bacterium]
MDLTGRCVLVTGGAHRVGKAIAVTLAKLGAAKVVFTFNSSVEAAEKTAQEIRAFGCEVLAIRCDQSDIQQIDQTIEMIMKKFGRLDVLINSASVLFEGEFMNVTPEAWDDVMNINVRGPFFFMQKAAPLMLEGDDGVIVNIIDESVVKPALKWVHHGASKSALWNITRSGSLAFAPKIRVNAVLPGAVLKPPDYTDEHWEGLIPTIPLRKLGSAEDVCQAVEYLINADFVTGQMIVVDGGVTVL